jgi:hypothetical protein
MLSSMHVGCIEVLGMKISSFVDRYVLVWLQATIDEDVRIAEGLGA